MFEIPFIGLKEGWHEFKFNIEDSFFEEFEMLEAKRGDIRVDIKLHKTAIHLELKINIRGSLYVPCDRCLEYFDLPIEFKGRLIVKFSDDEQKGDDEVMILHPGESSINLKQYIYESIGISIPYKKTHGTDKKGRLLCNPEIIKYLEDSSEKDTEDKIDPRWEGLEQLLKNKKQNKNGTS